MPHSSRRPLIVLLTTHWITMTGVALVTLAGFSWMFALPAHIRGHVSNPYIGLLLFFAIPAVFFVGLLLIPIGITLGRHRAAAHFETAPDRRTAWRRAAVFFGVMTVANVVIGSQLTYRAVEHMETVQFCGQTCHVMKPEFTAHQLPPHQALACDSCHIAPGAGGFLKAKMAGTRQLAAVAFNSFTRPIESAMESNRLVSSADTCEQCHNRTEVMGERLRTISKFKDDESNSRTETALMMLVGGGSSGGIHGAHLGPGVHIRYAAVDKERQTIPWVEYNNSESHVTRSYLASDTKPESIGALSTFDMQCVDCHNRAAHSFDLPDHAVDKAMVAGRIPVDLPFVKKTAVELLKVSYGSEDEAGQKIPAGLNAFYQQKYSDIWAKRSTDIQGAGQALLGIYKSNVFPDLKVTWGTYPNNLGHTDYPGCSRCHDDSHTAADKKTIPGDCSTCHRALAVEEPAPWSISSH